MASDRSDERTAALNNACTTAEQFIDLYYERIDAKRHTINKLYLDNATMSWNGNKITGK